MKKAINILLRISKVLDIVVIVAAAIFIVGGFLSIGTVIEAAGNLEAAGDNPSAELIVEFVSLLTIAITFPILGIVLSAGSIANIIIVSKSLSRLTYAKTKSDLRGLAIGNIITGCFSSETALVAGILMLVIKDRQL